MSPIRTNKKRKRAGEVVDQYASLLPPLPPQASPEDWWDGFSRRLLTNGKYKDPVTIESFCKMSRKTFDYICSLVEERMMAKPSNYTDLSGKPLTSKDRVAVALRRLSSGESLSSVGASLGINQSTVSHVTWRFVEIMEEKGLHHLRWPSTDELMKETKTKFEKIQGLPNCCGAIDTTHIMFCSNSVDPSNSVWCDQEKNHSMILQAIVDPEMRFLDIVTGWPGSLSDSQALRGSTFFELCVKGKRLNGKNQDLTEETDLREYIIGDSGFPNLPWLLTPYHGKGLSDAQAIFNERLSTTHKVAQRALAKLKETWKIIEGVMWRPDKNRLPSIILVCCVLHNILIDLNDRVQEEKRLFAEDHDPNYRQQVSKWTNETAANGTREKLARFLSRKTPP